MPSSNAVAHSDAEFSDSDSTDIAAIFHALRQRWKDEAGHFSVLQQKFLHPAYQEIIGLGRPAIPLILAEMKRGGRHWFWALQHIARANPVPKDASFEKAVEAWENWWISRQANGGAS